ncbi:MAG: hypothetical protein WBW04_20665 [Nitrolancea sp.]
MEFVDGNDGIRSTRSLFRGPAHLCISNDSQPGETSDYFAAAILRPGGASIQLRLEPLGPNLYEDGQVQSGWYRTGAIVEKTIREFVLQWDCDRSLWDEPAEATLPEFGTTAISREDA